MSKAEEANYLRYIELKNYKSIKDLNIDFKPGLNIIIGKNSSGKTNFLNGLYSALNFVYGNLSDSEASFSIIAKHDLIDIEVQLLKENEDDLRASYLNDRHHSTNLNINGNPIKIDNNDEVESYLNEEYFILSMIIKHGVPYENEQLIDMPLSFLVKNNGNISRDLVNHRYGYTYTRFLYGFLFIIYSNVLSPLRRQGIAEKIDLTDLKENIIDQSRYILSTINDYLKLYSPITKVRLNPEFNIIEEENGQKIAVSNFYLDFKVNNSWYPYNLLSDGTKRLFYIISEVIGPLNNKFFGNMHLGNTAPVDLDIVLFEEPELGIHPHQLHQLMLFIKEQSKEKQIILTTHSPQVLDILDPDELDRVIICDYDQQKGTQLHHLTEKQIKKAKKYMSTEGFLSEYWRFSDLEPAR